MSDDALFSDPRKKEILVANVEMARDIAVACIEGGEDPVEIVKRSYDHVLGFIKGEQAMVIPKRMIDPDDLARAVKRGQELAAEHGW